MENFLLYSSILFIVSVVSFILSKSGVDKKLDELD